MCIYIYIYATHFLETAPSDGRQYGCGNELLYIIVRKKTVVIRCVYVFSCRCGFRCFRVKISEG